MQPQKYERTTDFTERDGDDTDHAAINEEFDAAALSINQVRENLALIQRDDGALQNEVVTADALHPSAFDAVQASVNQATQEAQTAAESALTSATTANNAKDAALAAKTGAETARDASSLNSASASASASAALASQIAAAISEANADASEAAALSSKNSASASATSAGNSAATATTQAGIATTKAGESAASASAAAGSAATASTKATESANSADAALTSKNAAAASAVAAASSQTSAAGSAATATDKAAIATTKAAEAAASEAAALSSKNAAAASQTAAAASQAAAAASETSASGSASTATTQAGIATTKASEAAASAVSAAASASSAAALLDNFDDRYLGAKASAPTVDNDGNPLMVGALYFDSTTGKMRVYTASGWIDASSASVATLATFNYVATAGQTTFSGNDAAGVNLVYTVGAVIVTLNGIDQKNGVDYTATNGSSIVLTSAAAAGDELRVYAFGNFQVADTYSQAAADAKFVQKDGSGNVGIGLSNPSSYYGRLAVNNGIDKNLVVRGSIRLTGSSLQSIKNDAATDSPLEIYVGGAQLQLEAGTHTWMAGGYERMRIDSAGRVTMPYQPAFHALKTGGNVSANSTVLWNYVTLNSGNCYNSSNGRFTAPIAGRYLIHAHMNNSGGYGIHPEIRVNGGGTDIYRGFGYNGSGGQCHASITAVIQLNVGDYVNVYTGNYGDMQGEPGYNNSFTGYLIG